jgi:hypothetical protein
MMIRHKFSNPIYKKHNRNDPSLAFPWLYLAVRMLPQQKAPIRNASEPSAPQADSLILDALFFHMQ